MKIQRVALVATLVVIVCAGLTLAGRAKHTTEVIPVDGAKEAVVDFDFAAGTIIINPKDMTDIAQMDLFYDPEFIDVRVEKEMRNQTMFITAESDFENRRNRPDDLDHDWDVAFSTRTPMDLTLDMGACKAEVDLGGVPVRELNIDVGAASGTLEFSAPNPERMKEFQIDAGASSLDIISVGNANFEHFKFSGGAGSFDLDLRGTYSGESEVEIEVGLGNADIILPKGLPVRIESDNSEWFSSVDLHGGDVEEIGEGVYESPDFENAKIRLTISLDVGMGSIDIRWKK